MVSCVLACKRYQGSTRLCFLSNSFPTILNKLNLVPYNFVYISLTCTLMLWAFLSSVCSELILVSLGTWDNLLLVPEFKNKRMAICNVSFFINIINLSCKISKNWFAFAEKTASLNLVEVLCLKHHLYYFFNAAHWNYVKETCVLASFDISGSDINIVASFFPDFICMPATLIYCICGIKNFFYLFHFRTLQGNFNMETYTATSVI